MSNSYTPPKVWTWDAENGGQFASINRPVSGPTHEKVLPKGKHPLQLYSLATPNGVKVNIMLEELLAAGFSGAEYDAWLIKIGDGDQFGSGFVELNPNSKIPALLDTTNGIRVFESGSILLYLAEKFGAFLPKDPAKRTETLTYKVTSSISGFNEQNGTFVVDNIWPGKPYKTDYKLGSNWYTDRSNPELYDDIWQGGKTVLKWRNDVLLDWAKRWEWLQ